MSEPMGNVRLGFSRRGGLGEGTPGSPRYLNASG